MSLKIVKASEPMQVSNIVLTVYSAPGYGKTSLSYTAEKPLLLDFDKGSYRAAVRGDTVQIVSWEDVQGMTAADLAEYKTIIIDTAGRALDVLSQDIIAANPKAGRSDGSLSLQGFGSLKSRFAQWQSFLRSQGKDIVLICHMDEQKNGDDTMERIDAQGSSKNEIYKSSDAMCRIRLDNTDQRYLDFDPRHGGFGKNPAQLPKVPFPDPKTNPLFLASVIQKIKDAINQMTDEQADEVKKSEAWPVAIAEADTLEKFNGLIEFAQRDGKKYKALLVTEAEKRGYIFAKEAKAYKEAPKEAASNAKG